MGASHQDMTGRLTIGRNITLTLDCASRNVYVTAYMYVSRTRIIWLVRPREYTGGSRVVHHWVTPFTLSYGGGGDRMWMKSEVPVAAIKRMWWQVGICCLCLQEIMPSMERGGTDIGWERAVVAPSFHSWSYTEDGSSTSLQNVGNNVADCTTSHPRRH
jgi:hypothetical protein